MTPAFPAPPAAADRGAAESAAAPAEAAGGQALPGLHTPLPIEISGRTHGWLTAYRRYPVFSPAWARGRAATLGVTVVLATALLFGSVLVSAPDTAPTGAVVQTLIGVVLPLFLGPWLGSRVRARGWAPRREGPALVAAVLVAVLLVTGFNEWLAEPMKQRVAEWTGAVDEQGRRKRAALMIGVIVQPQDPATGAASAPPGTGRDADQRPHPRGPGPGSHLMMALLAFALAGGFALPRWWRERDGLATLARERELARAQTERREAEMRLSVLAAQVEPHFLFNTLAGVRSAIATDPARASEMIDRLSDYLRAAIPRLRSDGGSAATLAGQVEIARAYLGLMAARMPRLSYTIDVPASLQGAAFPPLMLISLAENAVKHGVEPKIGPAHIAIRAEHSADGRLQVTVADDGAGFGASAGGSGLGLANIRERLAQMHGERAALALMARPEGGVVASLVVPLDLPAAPAPPAAAPASPSARP
ncbi:MAG: histidine kinase [Rubrivivax sp.]|nr:histidine kinase [Rubrivivax sp.]